MVARAAAISAWAALDGTPDPQLQADLAQAEAALKSVILPAGAVFDQAVVAAARQWVAAINPAATQAALTNIGAGLTYTLSVIPELATLATTLADNALQATNDLIPLAVTLEQTLTSNAADWLTTITPAATQAANEIADHTTQAQLTVSNALLTLAHQLTDHALAATAAATSAEVRFTATLGGAIVAGAEMSPAEVGVIFASPRAESPTVQAAAEPEPGHIDDRRDWPGVLQRLPVGWKVSYSLAGYFEIYDETNNFRYRYYLDGRLTDADGSREDADVIFGDIGQDSRHGLLNVNEDGKTLLQELNSAPGLMASMGAAVAAELALQFGLGPGIRVVGWTSGAGGRLMARLSDGSVREVTSQQLARVRDALRRSARAGGTQATEARTGLKQLDDLAPNRVPAPHKFTGKSVADILKTKKGSIKNADLPDGSPSWDQIMRMTWDDIDAAAKANEPGFKTIRKLLTDRRFDR